MDMKKMIWRLVALLVALTLFTSVGVADDVEAVIVDTDEQLSENQTVADGMEPSSEDQSVAGETELPGEVGEIHLNAAADQPDPAEASEPVASAPEVADATENGDAQATDQDAVPAELELGVKQQYALKAASLAPGKKITYQTSKKSVATVSKTGVVKAVKKGKATIRCYAGKTLLAECVVTVVPAPKKVSLGVKKLTIGVKESVTLEPSITKGSLATFTWSSSKKKCASVSKGGRITGKKVGKATITVETQNGKKATVTVTVAKKPNKVTMSQKTASLNTGTTLQLKATLPSGTASYSKTWSSSNEQVATVTAKGKVTAVGVGEATITVETYNGKRATCVVTVTPTIRALLIGQEHFNTDTCSRNRGDVNLMETMLDSVSGLYGGRFAVTKAYDLNKSGVLKAIKSTFSGANEEDVSLFFIATHGNSSSTGAYAGALQMAPSGLMTIGELADALKSVPGKVIVILESCGSGAAVYANGGKSSSRMADLAAFDRAVIEAFSKADPGIEVTLLPNTVDSKGIRVNTGEMRLENKFYVLTASAYLEDSYGWESPRYHNVFTMWLTDGIGTSGTMPADANRNGQATLHELYSYIEGRGPGVPGNPEYEQHVQVYPSGSGFVLFKR